MRKIVFSGLAAMLWVGGALAEEWWEKKPYVKWSEKEVERMLDNSPWGKVHTVTIANTAVSTDFRTAGAGDLEREKRNLFHIRFLSAKPMRMAVARGILLNAKGKVNQDQLDRFVEKGDPDNIMLVMTLSAVPKGSSSVREYYTTLVNLRTPDLANNTFLATKTGKRVFLAHYEPPGNDGLGAKFFFPRKLEDGTPFVTVEDEEVRFETTLTMRNLGFSRTEEANVPGLDSRTDRIYRQFKLEDMVYEGKLEI